MTFTDAELEAYLDEALAPDDMSQIEQHLRENPQLANQLRAILGRRNAGVHSLGGIWRNHRVSCPNREDLGSYLLGVLDNDFADYITFHVQTIGCRLCKANLDDMQSQQQEAADSSETRRRKYFQSSAGYIKRTSE